MALPYNISPPAWLSDEVSWARGGEQRDQQRALFDMQMQEGQQKIASNFLSLHSQQQGLDLNAINIKNKTRDATVIPDWLKEHPTWQSRNDENTQWPTALTPEGESQLAQVRMRDAQSVQQKAAIAAVGDFAKRVDKLSAVDPASAGQFAPYIGKSNPSPTILQALSVAEQAAAQSKQNTVDQTTTDALSRGDVPTTTVGPRGVTTTYKPAAKNPNDEAPKTMALPNGATVAWMPGGKTLHVIQSDGKKQVYTPFQLQSIAKGLAETDPTKKTIMDFLSQSAVKQISGQGAPAANSDGSSFKVGDFTVTPK